MFRIFHYIDEIYRQQSFSRAAQKLYISQSSLSLMVKKFEERIGLQIFDRSTVPIRLTEAGKVYFDGIRQILRIQSDLETFVDDYKELRTGALSIGAPHMFSSYLLPPLIAKFFQLAPNVTTRLVEADFLRLHELALEGGVDLLIESHSFDAALFQSVGLFREQILLAVPAGDPVNLPLKACRLDMEDIRADNHMASDCPCVSLRAFSQQNFLILEKGHDMHARAVRLCRDSGFEPRVLMTLNQLMSAYNLADQQMGTAFVSDTIVKLSGSGRNLTFYKIADENAVRCVNLAYKKNRYLSKAMRWFIDLAVEICAGGIDAVIAMQRLISQNRSESGEVR